MLTSLSSGLFHHAVRMVPRVSDCHCVTRLLNSHTLKGLFWVPLLVEHWRNHV